MLLTGSVRSNDEHLRRGRGGEAEDKKKILIKKERKNVCPDKL